MFTGEDLFQIQVYLYLSESYRWNEGKDSQQIKLSLKKRKKADGLFQTDYEVPFG